ncbi:ABC transporter permease [Candidatus Sororendozoicomonas aggregata]|uniref:ABC transporter permease n=1 Tax=Candidatus Sororendozoicomonas aggregata TaxID=3073239 RepID=UPI002ED3932D
MVSRPFSTALLTGLLGVFFLPIMAGVAYVGMMAFGYFPPLGYNRFSLSIWRQLFDSPDLWSMLGLSLWVGVVSTLCSLGAALAIVSALWGSRWWSGITRWLSPMLAIPHVALAFGVSFLIMPSGLLGRLLAPVADWQYPPDWQTVQDPLGLSLIAVLILKETPFLIVLLIAALERLPVKAFLAVGQSLGYTPWMVWVKLLWPGLYAMVRLPVYAVLAFSLSVVDIALFIGPMNPPVFSVQLLEWLKDADVDKRLLACAGGLLLGGIVILAMAGMVVVEHAVAHVGRRWLSRGRRGSRHISIQWLSKVLWRWLLITVSGACGALVIWSFTWRWRFPALWPEDLTLLSWQRAWPSLSEPLYYSLVTGFLCALLSVVATVLILEITAKHSHRVRLGIERLMYIPMLLPQMSFLFGIQVLLLSVRWDGQLMAVVGAHVLFVLPYCYLSLSGPWQSYDQRYSLQGRLLSRSRYKTFIAIKLPLLWRPLVTSFALGFAVSIAQYLPTIFSGAGRISTITTEAVALAAGGSRQYMGVYGVMQMLLPMLVYGLALISGNRSLRTFRKRLTL